MTPKRGCFINGRGEPFNILSMCDFVFDPDLWYGDSQNLMDEPWKCPYQAVLSEKFCIFHILPQRRGQLVDSQEQLRSLIARTLSEYGSLHLICTSFQSLPLKSISEYLDEDSGVQIGFSWIGNLSFGREFKHSLQIFDSQIKHLDSEQTEFENYVEIIDSSIDVADLNRTTFKDNFVMEGSKVSAFNCIDSTFYESAYFGSTLGEDLDVGRLDEDPVQFRKFADFSGVKFRRIASFDSAEFSAGAMFMQAEFNSTANFRSVEVKEGISFLDAKCDGTFSLKGSRIDLLDLRDVTAQELDVSESELGSDFNRAVGLEAINHGLAEGINTHYDWTIEKADRKDTFRNALSIIGDISLVLKGVHVKGMCDLSDVELKAPVSAQQLMVSGELQASISTERGVRIIILHHAEIDKGEIEIDENSPVWEFGNARIGRLDFRSTGDISVFDRIFIDNTTFDNFDFPGHRKDLEKIDWEIDDVKTNWMRGVSDRSESTYSKARQGADQVGDKKAASQFFIKEHRIRRQQHKDMCLNEEIPLPTQGIALYQLTANWLYDKVCKYGESSGRVLILSVMTTLVFSMIYWILGVNPGFSPPILTVGDSDITLYGIDYLTFSIQAFTTLVLGGATEVDNSLVRFIASVEGFIGTFAVGLFVATLIRSVQR